jgi:hypothetical protein
METPRSLHVFRTKLSNLNPQLISILESNATQQTSSQPVSTDRKSVKDLSAREAMRMKDVGQMRIAIQVCTATPVLNSALK